MKLITPLKNLLKLPKKSGEDKPYKVREEKAIEPDPEKWGIANSVVVSSVIRTKGEQKINFGSIIWALFGVSIFIFWFWSLGKTTDRAEEQKNARATRMAENVEKFGVIPMNKNPIIDGDNHSTDIPTISPDLIMTPEMLSTYAASVFYATLEAGYTPTPSPTPSPSPTSTDTPGTLPTSVYSVDFIFKYSYYNPKLGGVNCFLWDAVNNDCISPMANGEDWKNNYGVAVACPPDIALGTIVVVSYPDAMKGTWICKDRGSAIVGNWIDFLDIKQRAQWGESVSAKLYPPTTPMEQINIGSH